VSPFQLLYQINQQCPQEKDQLHKTGASVIHQGHERFVAQQQREVDKAVIGGGKYAIDVP
jgi:hypothetical protein